MTTTVNVPSIQGERYPTPDIPNFEGAEVTHTKARVVSASSIDIGDQVFRIDDTVRMVVETRVEGIGHDVDKDGKLVRVHRMRVLDSVVIDWTMDLDVLRQGLQS